MAELNDPFRLTSSFYKEFFDFGAYCSVQVKFRENLDLPAGRVGFICSNHDIHFETIENYLNFQKGKVERVTMADIEAMVSRFNIIYLTNFSK